MHFALLLAVALAQWSTNGPRNGITSHLTASAGPRPRLYTQAYLNPGGNGIYRSDDAGSSWRRMDYPCADTCVALAVDPNNPDRVFAADFHYSFSGYSSRLSSSVDGGASWTARLTRFGTSTCSLAVDPLTGSVYASFGDIPTLFRSDDDGETFAGFPVPFAGAFLVTAADGALLAAQFGNVFVSRDRGENWSSSAQVPVLCSSVVLAADRRDPLRWYVGSAPCGDVARTDDGGASWTPVTNAGGPVNGIATDASSPGLVYVSTGSPVPSAEPGRVLASLDGGDTWIELGGPAAGGIGDLVVSIDGSHIYATTSSGVYRLDLRRPRTAPPR